MLFTSPYLDDGIDVIEHRDDDRIGTKDRAPNTRRDGILTKTAKRTCEYVNDAFEISVAEVVRT